MVFLSCVALDKSKEEWHCIKNALNINFSTPRTSQILITPVFFTVHRCSQFAFVDIYSVQMFTFVDIYNVQVFIVEICGYLQCTGVHSSHLWTFIVHRCPQLRSVNIYSAQM